MLRADPPTLVRVAGALGAYLIGSLAHPGFSRSYGAFDMAPVTVAGLSANALDWMRSDVVALSTQWTPQVPPAGFPSSSISSSVIWRRLPSY
jgi:hypothetical protein